MSLGKASLLLSLSLLPCLLGNAVADDVQEKQMINCIEEADLQCVKLRALADVYKFIKSRSVELVDGVSLEYSGASSEAVTARSLADQGWGSLFDFIPRFSKGLSLKFNIIPGGSIVVSKSRKENGLLDVSVEPRQGFEGRNDEKRKVMMSMMMFGGLYSTLFILGLAAAKFIAFKGVIVGAIALVISLINGLSKLANRNRLPYAYSRVDGPGYGNIEKSFAENLIISSIQNNKEHYGESRAF